MVKKLVNKQWTIGLSIRIEKYQLTTKSTVEMSLINADPLEALGTTEEGGLGCLSYGRKTIP